MLHVSEVSLQSAINLNLWRTYLYLSMINYILGPCIALFTCLCLC